MGENNIPQELSYDHATRQRVLEDFGVLDGIRDEGLDAAVRLAALVCECPSTFISFVDWKSGLIRFKHNVGMAFPEAPIVPGESFCDLSVMSSETVNIGDTTKHPTYFKSRFVVGEPHILFYYGVRLFLDQEVGVPVGVLCVIDSKPRQMRQEQKDMMEIIAQDVVRQLRLKRVISKSQARITELYQHKQTLENTLSNKDLLADRNSDAVQVQQNLNVQFLACLSHELRTPTNIIQCSSLLLQSTPLNAEQTEYIQCIQEGVLQLRNVLDKSIEHLDASSQTHTNNATVFNIHKFIEKLLADCSSKSRQSHREMLDPVIEVDVPPLLVGDSAKVAQILGYFLENSIKFTDDSGKIGVHVRLHKEGHDRADGSADPDGGGGGLVVDFSVIDDGVGMNSDTIALLFKSLLQRDRSTTRTHGGMGFGLVTSQNLATMLNGSITVASKQKGDQKQLRLGDTTFAYPRGSIFTLSVPLSQSPTPHADPMCIATTPPPPSLAELRSAPLTLPSALTIPPTLPASSSSLSNPPIQNGPTRPHITIPSPPDFNKPSHPLPQVGPSSAPVSPSTPYSPFTPLAPFTPFSTPSTPSSITPNGTSTPSALLDLASMATKFKSARILVVEDNVMNTKVLKRMLEKMGFAPDCVSDGAQALSKFTEYPDYSLVLMDLHMPVMDGLTATKNILDIADAMDRQTKVVAVTSSVSVDVRRDCVESGMSGFIAKPISLDALVTVLNSIV